MVDRLAILLERFAVTASVFHAGALCGINTLAGEDDAGQLHLVRRGPLQVSHGQQIVQVEVPSLLLYPRPMPHRFSTDPQHGADMACANLHFEGGRLNPISAALPDFIACRWPICTAATQRWSCCSKKPSSSAAGVRRWSTGCSRW